jgi:hypothetical protein
MKFAASLTCAGCSLITAGAAWVYPPAGLILGGAFLAATGLLVEFDKAKRKAAG